LRHWIADDPKQAVLCTKLLAAIEAGKYKAIVPPIVFAELGWTLTSFYKLDKATTVLHMESILQTRHIFTKTESNTALATALYQQYSIKWTDCLLLSCLDSNTMICSFDHALDKVDSITRVSPGQLL